MAGTLKPYSMITDFVSGREIPNIGAEENRQAVAQYLVNEKGYSKYDIEVDVKIEISLGGENYCSRVDLVVKKPEDHQRIMAIKCAAGSLGSREREIIAAARLLDDYQIPFAVVSDGKTAILLDTVSGKKTGSGMAAIPSKEKVTGMLESYQPVRLAADRLEREKLIFRTYDIENVNVQRTV
ncbi:MAG: type I restriction enzyme HsdR N-terminal domain-containing protein [bacterium]|nr:type I restriction enzyme HsdR N-terminal domain-containing protein [bacterium]